MVGLKEHKTFPGRGHSWRTIGQAGAMVTERCTACNLEIDPSIKGQRERGECIPCVLNDGGEQQKEVEEYTPLIAEFHGSCGHKHKVRVKVTTEESVRGDDRKTIFEYVVKGVEVEEVQRKV